MSTVRSYLYRKGLLNALIRYDYERIYMLIMFLWINLNNNFTAKL